MDLRLRDLSGIDARVPAEEHAPEQMVDTIRQAYAGIRRVPQEIAAHLAEHLGDERLRAVRSTFCATSPVEIGIAISPKCFSFPKKRSRFTSSTSWKSWGQPTGRMPSRSQRAADSFAFSFDAIRR
jgi:hypothetical protein